MKTSTKIINGVVIACLSMMAYRACFWLADLQGIRMSQGGAIFAAVGVFLICWFVVIPFVNKIYQKDNIGSKDERNKVDNKIQNR